MGRKQFWLDEWERDLILRALDFAASQADSSVTHHAGHDIQRFACRYIRDRARLLKAKFQEPA